MNILIADDDAVSRKLLETTLQKLGHQVIAVGDGRAAYDRLTRASAPRLAILDWMMPELDGLAVCRALRAREGPYTYVIVLTARDRREDMVAGLDAQADDFLTKPFDIGELQARIQSGKRVLELQEGLLATQAALHHEATHDRLTGLWNRGQILDHLGRQLTRAQRGELPLMTALVDIDHFKMINDTYGHDTGDMVLATTAERMQAVLRRSDGIGRYGGEEFLVVIGSNPGDSMSGLQSALERVRLAAGSKPIDTRHGPLSISVSIGAVIGVPEAEAPATLIGLADQELYRAKAAGRNCTKIAECGRAVPQESSLITPLRSAYNTMSV